MGRGIAGGDVQVARTRSACVTSRNRIPSGSALSQTQRQCRLAAYERRFGERRPMVFVERRFGLNFFVGAVVGVVAPFFAHCWCFLAHTFVVDVGMSLCQGFAVALRQRSSADTPVEVVSRLTLHTLAFVLEEVKVFENSKVRLPIVTFRAAAEILLSSRCVFGARCRRLPLE